MRHPLFVLALASVLAHPAALRAQAPQPASTTPPTLAAPKALTLPTMVERVLPNGLRLIVVEQHEIPVVDAQLVIRTGSEADPATKAGLATLVANMLDEGAGARDALALAEEIGFLAIRLNTNAGFEQSGVSLHSTRATLDSAMALMADVVLRPTFPDKEFARLRAERLTALLQEQDRGPALADRAFQALVFGDAHPYGRSTSGTRETVDALTLEDVRTFWRTWYRPNNATLVIVGDLTVDEAQALAQRTWGGWERSALPALAAYPAPTARSRTTIHIVDKPKAAQSSFRIGEIGVPRSTPDYYALTVLNTALGGSFTSRLNAKLREAKGYTYGAGSSFSMRRAAGPFVARAEVVSAKTDSALIEFLYELREIRKPMPADELAKAKRYLQLGYADGFESSADIAAQIANLVPYTLPLSTLRAFNRGIAQVTTADIQRVAQRYIDPSRLTVVIAGDRASIEPALRATKIAPVDVRDARGRPVTPPAPARAGSATRPNARAATAVPMLVSTAWLAEHQDDRDLVLLHVGSKAAYDSGHVAGARHVTLDDVAIPMQPGALMLQVAGTDQLSAWAVRNGISDRSRIVVIPHDTALQSATRVYLTLAYLGAIDRTSLLDGSFQAWKREQRPVSTVVPVAAPTVAFTPRLRPDLIATMQQVEAVTVDRSQQIVDARLTRFFEGNGGGYPRPGHIPTAVNIPLNTVAANGYLKPVTELRALFAAAGADPAKPVITYCHIGQQATLLWFAATLIGREARMYDGSFQEWSGSTLPVVNRSAPGADR